MVFDVAGLPVKHGVAFEIKAQVITFPFISVLSV